MSADRIGFAEDDLTRKKGLIKRKGSQIKNDHSLRANLEKPLSTERLLVQYYGGGSLGGNKGDDLKALQGVPCETPIDPSDTPCYAKTKKKKKERLKMFLGSFMM